MWKSKLALVVGAPAVDLAFGVESENMGPASSELDDGREGAAEFYFSNGDGLLVLLESCLHTDLLAKRDRLLGLLSLSPEAVMHAAPAEDSAFCGQEESVERGEGHLSHEIFGNNGFRPVDFLKSCLNLLCLQPLIASVLLGPEDVGGDHPLVAPLPLGG